MNYISQKEKDRAEILEARKEILAAKPANIYDRFPEFKNDDDKGHDQWDKEEDDDRCLGVE
jgi:hypothetical protein